MKCQFLDFVYDGSVPMQVAAAWFEESVGKGEWFKDEMPEDSEFVCHLQRLNADMYYDNDRECYFVARKANISENTMGRKKRINENHGWGEGENMSYDMNNVKMWYDKLVALLPTIKDVDKKHEVECVLGSLETCLEDPSELTDWDMQHLQDGFLRNLCHGIENNSGIVHENKMKYTKKVIRGIVAEQFMRVLCEGIGEAEGFDTALEADKRMLRQVYMGICKALERQDLTPEQRRKLEDRKAFIEKVTAPDGRIPRRGEIVIDRDGGYSGDIYDDGCNV